MIAAQHNCEGLLKFILPDVNLEVMTLTGVHIYRSDRNCSEKSFIPCSEENTPCLAFLKRVKEIQGENSKEFFKSILVHDLEPNFKPKQPCKCPKLAKLANSQWTK